MEKGGEELQLAGDGDGGGGDSGAAAVAAAAQGRRRRLGDRGVAVMVSSWPGRGVAAVVAAAAVAVGLLPRPSVSSHLRWRKLFFFLK